VIGGARGLWIAMGGGLLLTCAAALAASAAHADELDAALGRALFKRQWVPAPSSTDASDGLGPLFNARSCEGCHRGGGASRVAVAPSGRRELAGAVVRLGTGEGAADPVYGVQLQTQAVPGLEPEGRVTFLKKLTVTLSGPPLAHGVHAGVRQAPPLHGRAILDDIADDEILKRDDPDDRDGDGISGRAHRIDGRIGRFDWKAGRATLESQIARAFRLDLGMSSPPEPLPYGDCTPLQAACLAAPNGESAVADGREVSSRILMLIGSYLRTLRATSPPADPEGERLFAVVKCVLCHVPEMKDRAGTPQRVFSDLLLHDMGPDLDDGVGEPGVNSSEWRTAPLTGRNGAGGARYLHDGSAKTIAEAIAKHGGEAAAARDAFNKLQPSERQKLIDYVRRL
jgi:CxxC motif-containing protein (DUF1111 family)